MAWLDECDQLDCEVRDVFGESITYQPQVGAPSPIVAVFDVAGAVVDLQAGVPVQSTAPTLLVRLADLPARPRAGDHFTRANGQAYEVTSVTPDGPGAVKLVAFEAAS